MLGDIGLMWGIKMTKTQRHKHDRLLWWHSRGGGPVRDELLLVRGKEVKRCLWSIVVHPVVGHGGVPCLCRHDGLLHHQLHGTQDGHHHGGKDAREGLTCREEELACFNLYTLSWSINNSEKISSCVFLKLQQKIHGFTVTPCPTPELRKPSTCT